MNRLLLLGHGRMGQLVEQLAPSYGFELAGIVTDQDPQGLTRDYGRVDVAIDFTLPYAVPANLPVLAARGINVVVGTTGWQAHEAELRAVVAQAGTAVLASANFARHEPLRAAGGRGRRRLGRTPTPAPDPRAASQRQEGRASRRSCCRAVSGRLRAASTWWRRVPARSGTHTIGFDGPSETITLTHQVRDRGVFARGGSKRRAGWWAARFRDSSRDSGDQTMRTFSPASAPRSSHRSPPRRDEAAAAALAPRQIDLGTHFLVPCGTTGSAHAHAAERRRVVRSWWTSCGGRLRWPAPAATPRSAPRKRCGGRRTGCSQTPYYMPTQEASTALQGDCREPAPIIVYNVPGRAGVNIEPSTLARLATLPNIIGVKEASGNISQMVDICRLLPSDFLVLSGDERDVPLMATAAAASSRCVRTRSRARWPG
jgi:hypothetical protein